MTVLCDGGCSLAGQKSVKCSEYEALFELATVCAMCNESSVDYNEARTGSLC